MSKLVVGPSAVMKWFIPEIYSDAASRLLQDSYDLVTIDLLVVEVGALLYRKIGLQEISEQEARDILTGLHAMPLDVHPSAPLIDLAFEVARDLELDFCDSLYIAMGIREGCPIVTADRALFASLKDGPYAKHLMWVEDVI